MKIEKTAENRTENFDKPQPEILITVDDDTCLQAAQTLAITLNTELTDSGQIVGTDATVLRFAADGVSLNGDGQTLRADFMHMIPRLRQCNLQNELLIKAAKIKNSTHQLNVIDATAGFGEDSLLLAAAGYSVRLYEYNPIIAALLRDALSRAAHIPELAETVARMELFEENSIDAMACLNEPPDVILLDPMFPERQKSALVKKKFQLLHLLEQPCMNECELLNAAITAKPRKIIIKRPPKGPLLAGVKPSYSLAGKAVRYDCLVYARTDRE